MGTNLNPDAGGVEGNCSRMLQFIDATAPGQPIPESVLKTQPKATPSPTASPSPRAVPQYNFTGPGGCKSKTGCTQYCSTHKNECADTNYTIYVAVNTTVLGSLCSDPQSCLEYCKGDISNETGEVKDECGSVNNDYAAAQEDLFSAIAGQQSAEISSETMDQLINQQLDSLPDVVDLDKEMQYQLSAGLAQGRQALGTATLACDLLVVAAVVLALLISLVAFSVRGAMRHVGWPLFIAGLAATILALLGPKMILDTVAQGMAGGGQFAQAMGVLMDVAAGIVKGYFNTVLIPAAITCILGLGLVIYSFKMKDKEQEKAGKEDPKKEPEEKEEASEEEDAPEKKTEKKAKNKSKK